MPAWIGAIVAAFFFAVESLENRAWPTEKAGACDERLLICAGGQCRGRASCALQTRTLDRRARMNSPPGGINTAPLCGTARIRRRALHQRSCESPRRGQGVALMRPLY